MSVHLYRLYNSRLPGVAVLSPLLSVTCGGVDEGSGGGAGDEDLTLLTGAWGALRTFDEGSEIENI
jgi:hypothetical protein